MRVLLFALLIPCVVGLAPRAHAEDELLDEAQSLVELGNRYTDIGTDQADEKKIKEGVESYRKALALYEKALARDGQTAAETNRIKARIVDVESRIEWYEQASVSELTGKEAPKKKPEVKLPPRERGEQRGAWCRRVRKLYDATDDDRGRARLARGMGTEAGVLALPVLYALFEREEWVHAREGIHEALAAIGTWRVAKQMGSYARTEGEPHWDAALDVIYRCLAKPQKQEPERPYLRAVRRYHKLKNPDLTARILGDLDALGPSGTAALGEVIYVDDFGFHDSTIALLAKKRDRRAVPPLVYKMNRFKFDPSVQVPAHKALLQMGWYAVPELINRLNDKAAGIWISWTLRKITGETMGTDKRKWHDWWKTEKVRHPELYVDPEGAPVGKQPAPTTGGGRK